MSGIHCSVPAGVEGGDGAAGLEQTAGVGRVVQDAGVGQAIVKGLS